ncbi:nucleotide exchange factor GrpE [Oceanicoccus sp. KOV_DT_Chl]|uniref:nucleotide exchange factor GrpE n=1 Tax=Oceanicoccus sp. KOV_DT_Chl TaxID=1904639 RepID=UPI001F2483B0|nr:nucleotide exchange factor GrpE [Oceanicoccus sp. KOV_DT_Chl]
MSNEEQTNPEVEELVDEIAADDAEVNAAEAEQAQSPEAQIEELQEQLAKTKDDALRTLAEAQNIKRRAEQDIDKARKFALEKFSTDLLAIADNLQRAVDAADKDNESLKPLVEGVELTQKALNDTFAKHGVLKVDPIGEPFDPTFHQAISMVENPDVEPNTVTMVMQTGYTLNERLLRPAMVMVSKAAPAASVDEQA